MTNSNDIPKAPPKLGPQGRRFWHDMNEAHTFSVAELRLLERACRHVDTVAKLEELVAREGLVIDSPQGGRTHPAVVELRHQSAALRGLVAALSLPPDEDSAGETARQRRARRAAESRWKVAR